jgi:hypothetical protein
MRSSTLSVICALVLFSLLVGPVPANPSPLQADAPPASAPAPANASAALRGAPLMFVENAGQWDARARFQVRGGGGTLWLAEDALWITLLEPAQRDEGPDLPGLEDLAGLPTDDQPRQGVNIRLSFVGANPRPLLEPFNRLDMHVSYFLGNDPTRWHADVPVWGGVRYVELYPGIDMELSGEGGQWQSRLIAQPGADVSAVHLRVEGAEDDVQETSDLALLRAYPFHPFPESVDSLSHSLTNLIYSTFLGGSDSDGSRSIAVDASGAAYVTGATLSIDFPTTPGAFDPTNDGGDTFITKLNAAGSGLVYSTFLGGSSSEVSTDIAVDQSGMIYVTGSTRSTDFPTTQGAFQPSHGGGTCGPPPNTYPCYDAFVTQLNEPGTALVYSSFLGSSGVETGSSIALDSSGSAYLTGFTSSFDFPTTPGAFQTACGNPAPYCDDAFVTKVAPDGRHLVYSTFLGGNGGEDGYGITVAGNGVAYVTGYTIYSSDFPVTPGAFQTTPGGSDDAFVTALNATGSGLWYSTYLGGSNIEYGYSIAVDMSGLAHVTGLTVSPNFPTTPGAFQTTCCGAFITKLNDTGTNLSYSTFLGSPGPGLTSGHGIAVDEDGMIYVTGGTNDTSHPITPGAFQTTYGGGGYDAFLTKLYPGAGSGLAYSTFLGGSLRDFGWGIMLDMNRAAYVAGATESSNFPTTPGVFDPTFGGGTCGTPPNTYPCADAFLTKLVPVITPYKLYLPIVLNDS